MKTLSIFFPLLLFLSSSFFFPHHLPANTSLHSTIKPHALVSPKTLQSFFSLLKLSDKGATLLFTKPAKDRVFFITYDTPYFCDENFLIHKEQKEKYLFQILCHKTHEQRLDILISPPENLGLNIEPNPLCFSLELDRQKLESLRNEWKVCGQKVDSTWAKKFNLRAIGEDFFLKEHGGKTFSSFLGKEKLTLTLLDGKQIQWFQKMGQTLYWHQKQWQKTHHKYRYPSLTLSEIDSNTVNIKLQDNHGLFEQNFALNKNASDFNPLKLLDTLKIKKTISQSQFELGFHDQVLICQIGDWLYFDQDQLILVNSLEKLHALTSPEFSNPILILNHYEKKTVQATLYSPEKNQVFTVNIFVQNQQQRSCEVVSTWPQ